MLRPHQVAKKANTPKTYQNSLQLHPPIFPNQFIPKLLFFFSTRSWFVSIKDPPPFPACQIKSLTARVFLDGVLLRIKNVPVYHGFGARRALLHDSTCRSRHTRQRGMDPKQSRSKRKGNPHKHTTCVVLCSNCGSSLRFFFDLLSNTRTLRSFPGWR